MLHRCWVDRTPYDEARYLLALQKRQAPLLRSAAPPLRRRAPELVFIDGPSQGVSYAASGFYTSSSRFFSLFHQPELAALITLEIPKER
jgi:hypothetical protein